MPSSKYALSPFAKFAILIPVVAGFSPVSEFTRVIGNQLIRPELQQASYGSVRACFTRPTYIGDDVLTASLTHMSPMVILQTTESSV